MNQNRLTRYPFLDGLRALSVIWLTLFHSLWFIGFFTSKAEFISVLKSGLGTYFLLQGHLGVDVFFALSGFLITHVLLDLTQKSSLTAQGNSSSASSGVLGAFYRRRAFRIFPAYMAVALIYVVCAEFSARNANVGNLWANLLLINNYLPVYEQAMGWTWSLAIEEQFYLVFPILFLALASGSQASTRRMLGWMVGLLLLAVAIRAFVVYATGPWPTKPAHPNLDGQYFFQYFDQLYGRTHMRIGGIILGIIARLAVADDGVRAWFNRRPWVARGCFSLALMSILSVLLITLVTVVAKIPEARVHPWSATFDRYLFTAGVAYLIFHMAAIEKGGGVLRRFLDRPFWRFWAEISYVAFLVNPIVFSVFGTFYRDSYSGSMLRSYLIGSVTVTFALAFLINRWIEAPMRRLGRLPLSEIKGLWSKEALPVASFGTEPSVQR